MGSADQINDRSFKADFSEEGVAKLRERVKFTLKEFMGDYTDDTLVEYVIVLLRNGRRKEEAQSELNVFLGDDSESFVNWLWDHLAESMDDYIHSQESHVEETAKSKSLTGSENGNEYVHMDSETEKEPSDKSRLSRRTREWRDIADDSVKVPPLISSVVHKIHYEEKNDYKDRLGQRSPSPQSQSLRKRGRTDDQQPEQREAKPDVSRRLLQFAVRDALAISKPSNSLKEPSLKRLRSVVSTSTQEAAPPDPPRRIRSVARAVNPMAHVMKAVTEAAEDVKKAKPGRSVFDRISLSTDLSETINQDMELREAISETEKGDMLIQPPYPHSLEYNGIYNENIGNYDAGSFQPNVMSGQGRLNIGVNVSHTSVSARNRIVNPTRQMNNVVAQNHLNAAATRHNSASFSGVMDPGKQSKHQEQREVEDRAPQRSMQERKVVIKESIAQPPKGSIPGFGNGNGNIRHAANVQQEAPKKQISTPGTLSTNRPLEDADVRTIFVTNVHFGATKDSLTRHFNKFGEVLKAVIVIDPATGQPTGSAHIEFARKEAADNALSLDGTSFMSRILKIVKGSSSPQDAASSMTWSRGPRGSPYAAVRFPRAPYGRGIPGAFRGRPPIRPGGARSLQWKRDSPAAPSDTSSSIGTSVLAPPARSLTYVRDDHKSETAT